MIKLRKTQPSGRTATKTVTITPLDRGEFLVSVTGSVVQTVHHTRDEAEAQMQRRIEGLESQGWRRVA